MSKNSSRNYSVLKKLIREFFLDGAVDKMKKEDIKGKYGIRNKTFENYMQIIRAKIKKGGINGQYTIDADPQNCDINPLYEMYGLKDYKDSELIRYLMLIHGLTLGLSKDCFKKDCLGAIEEVERIIKTDNKSSEEKKGSKKTKVNNSANTDKEDSEQNQDSYSEHKNLDNTLSKINTVLGIPDFTSFDSLTFDDIWHLARMSNNSVSSLNAGSSIASNSSGNTYNSTISLSDDQKGLIDYLSLCTLANPFGYFATNIKKYLLLTYREDVLNLHLQNTNANNQNSNLGNYSNGYSNYSYSSNTRDNYKQGKNNIEFDKKLLSTTKYPEEENVFRVLNVFFATALEEGLMHRLIQCMHSGKLVKFNISNFEKEDSLTDDQRNANNNSNNSNLSSQGSEVEFQYIAQPLKILSSLQGGKIYCVFLDPYSKDPTTRIFYVRVDYIIGIKEVEEPNKDCWSILEEQEIIKDYPDYQNYNDDIKAQSADTTPHGSKLAEESSNLKIATQNSNIDKFQQFRRYILDKHITWGAHVTGKDPKNKVSITFEIDNSKPHQYRRFIREKRNGTITNQGTSNISNITNSNITNNNYADISNIENGITTANANNATPPTYTTYVYEAFVDDTDEMLSWLNSHMGKITDIKVNNNSNSTLANSYWADLCRLANLYDIAIDNKKIPQNILSLVSNINGSNAPSNNAGTCNGIGASNKGSQTNANSSNKNKLYDKINIEFEEDYLFYNEFRSSDYYNFLALLSINVKFNKAFSFDEFLNVCEYLNINWDIPEINQLIKNHKIDKIQNIILSNNSNNGSNPPLYVVNDHLFSKIEDFITKNKESSNNQKLSKQLKSDILKLEEITSLYKLYLLIFNNLPQPVSINNSNKAKGGNSNYRIPLTLLEKRWLLSALNDERASLYLSKNFISSIKEKLHSVNTNNVYARSDDSNGNEYSTNNHSDLGTCIQTLNTKDNKESNQLLKLPKAAEPLYPLYDSYDIAYYDQDGSEDISKTGKDNISLEREYLLKQYSKVVLAENSTLSSSSVSSSSPSVSSSSPSVSSASSLGTSNHSFYDIYRQCVEFCKSKEFVSITYKPVDGTQCITKTVLPLNVEYSRKNDLSRLRVINIAPSKDLDSENGKKKKNNNSNNALYEYKYIEIVIHTIASINPTIFENCNTIRDYYDSYMRLKNLNRYDSEDKLINLYYANDNLSREIKVLVIDLLGDPNDPNCIGKTKSRFITEFSDYAKININNKQIALLYPHNAQFIVFLKLLSFGSALRINNNCSSILDTLYKKYNNFYESDLSRNGSFYESEHHRKGFISNVKKKRSQFNKAVTRNQYDAETRIKSKIIDQIALKKWN